MNEWWMKTVSARSDHPELAEKFNETRLDKVDVQGGTGVLSAGESGIFRAHLFVPSADLAATNITVRFGAIKDDGSVYVNGKLAGESHNPAASPAFNVRPLIHAGVNTVAVLVNGKTDSGGLGGGVSVEFPAPPASAGWKRSAFNGLAQVIVQSDKQAGTVNLTASADGLTAATVNIVTQPGIPRPSVP